MSSTVATPTTSQASLEATVAQQLETSRKRRADSEPEALVESSSTQTSSDSAEPSRYKKQRKEANVNDSTAKIRTLFTIIQDRELTVAERNMRFVQELSRMQLAAFKHMAWREEFTTGALHLKICSANNRQPQDASTSLPFFVLNSSRDLEPILETDCGLAKPASNITSAYNGTRIDFQSVVLPDGLRAEVNQEALVKQKAGVCEISTLQQWAKGTTYRYETVQVKEPMPDIVCPAYSAVTLVPLMKTDSQTVGLWDPFFKGSAGVKLMLTYGDDVTCQEALGGASAYVTTDAFTVIHDSPAEHKKHHWKVGPVALTDDQLTDTVDKIKKAAVNIAIVPFSSVDSAAFSRSAVQQVEPELAMHMKIRAIPIDISGITTEVQLETYLISLEQLFIRLADTREPQVVEAAQAQSSSSNEQPLSGQKAPAAAPKQPEASSSTAPQVGTGSAATPPSAPVSTTEPATQDVETLAQKLTGQVTQQVEWHKNFWPGLFK